MKNRYILFLCTFISLFSGCKDDPEPCTNCEEELITDVVLSLAEQGGTDTVMATFNDPDGEGGTAPIIVGVTLKAGKAYHGRIELYNKSQATVDTITHEVEKEADAHRFDFTSTQSRITFEILDKDVNNLPIGLDFRATVLAGTSGTDTVNVRLNHFSEGMTKGVSNAGDTDIEIDFPVTIE